MLIFTNQKQVLCGWLVWKWFISEFCFHKRAFPVTFWGWFLLTYYSFKWMCSFGDCCFLLRGVYYFHCIIFKHISISYTDGFCTNLINLNALHTTWDPPRRFQIKFCPVLFSSVTKDISERSILHSIYALMNIVATRRMYISTFSGLLLIWETIY